MNKKLDEIDRGRQTLKSSQLKRKKSVHFPKNPVIPIDDSSDEGSI